MVSVHTKLKRPRNIKRIIESGNIPESLVYERIDGKPIYRRGYKDVLTGQKTLEDIMGSSTLQSVLAAYIAKLIFRFIDDDRFFVLINESGVHLDHRNNLANDISIFDQQVLTPAMINLNYASVPPKIAIEIDVKADTSELTEMGYIFNKTQKLLDFGVEKVIWIITNAKKVTVSTAQHNWETMDWDKDIEIMDGHTFNAFGYLQSKGILLDER